MFFRVELEPDDNGTMLVRFPDVPEAITFADSDEDALGRAEEALRTALEVYMADRRPLPPSVPMGGEGMAISLGLLGSIKLAIYQAMLERGWRKADLARALAQNPRQIDRLFNLRHASPVPQLEAALQAMDREARFALV